ncbi:uncharacterized protein LOC133298514 [Gastrolobium bilobum]|uniref:uncharacterized protein LOC133298514 n=1 Tax=Gastrolobium bilobum TaxID=150636 RepID=UPI002AB2ED66|nr:uncharacterized protein LOC133298514 [Gastrolobium bilobum]
MAYPYGNHQEQQQTMHVVSSFNRNSATERAILHNPGISLDWTLEEQAVFQKGLIQFASVPSMPRRYNLIANQLPNKTVREVILRDKWMREESQPVKWMDEKVSHPAAKSSAFTARPNVSPYAPGMIVMDNDDGISSKAIGGPTGELLEQNAQALKQISANINAACKYQDNIKLFCQTRDNIYKILNNFNDMSEVMKKMPRLPVKIDEELISQLQTFSNKRSC